MPLFSAPNLKLFQGDDGTYVLEVGAWAVLIDTRTAEVPRAMPLEDFRAAVAMERAKMAIESTGVN